MLIHAENKGDTYNIINISDFVNKKSVFYHFFYDYWFALFHLAFLPLCGKIRGIRRIYVKFA